MHNGNSIPTSMVRVNGKPAVLLTVLKLGAASTLDVVTAVKAKLPRIRALLPPGRQAGPASRPAALRAQRHRWGRSGSSDRRLPDGPDGFTVSGKLAQYPGGHCLDSALYPDCNRRFGRTASNAEYADPGRAGTGGRDAGDDATVEVENTTRNLGEGMPLRQAILTGARQVALPALTSTLSICIVFVPVAFLSGVSQSLFLPLALAVVLAMLPSYILSRTLVTNMMLELLGKELDAHQPHAAGAPQSLSRRGIIWRIHGFFDRRFEKVRSFYRRQLEWAVYHRAIALAFLLAIFRRVRCFGAQHRRGLLS